MKFNFDDIPIIKINHLVRFTFIPSILLGIFSLICIFLERNFQVNEDDSSFSFLKMKGGSSLKDQF